jgi:hypothetical protein
MKKVRTLIYVFSGTGNSLHIAKELGRRLSDSPVLPMVTHLEHRKLVIDADVLGLVFPVHALTLPIAVRFFLRRLRFRHPAYVFSVATRGGTLFRGFEPLNRILRRKGVRLNARFLLDMPNNDPRGRDFQPADEAAIIAVERNLQTALDFIAAAVTDRRDVDSLPLPTIELPFSPLKNRIHRIPCAGRYGTRPRNRRGPVFPPRRRMHRLRNLCTDLPVRQDIDKRQKAGLEQADALLDVLRLRELLSGCFGADRQHPGR